MGENVNYQQLIAQLEDEKLDALMRYGESEQTLRVFEKNDAKLKKLYDWLLLDLEKGVIDENLVKRPNY